MSTETACVSCNEALPAQARFCGRCGSPQPDGASSFAPSGSAGTPAAPPMPPTATAPPPPAPPQPDRQVDPSWVPSGSEAQAAEPGRRFPSRLLFMVAGGVVALGLLWVGYSVLTGGTGGSSDVLVAQDLSDGFSTGDLYVLDSIDEVENPDRESRVLRDVAIGGSVLVADGADGVRYGLFEYEHDGGVPFLYQEDDETEWTLALLDGSELVEVDRFDSRPRLIGTDSGLYLIEEESRSCAIFRLTDRSTDRVARADRCVVNGAADRALLADVRSSGVELSIVELATDEQLEIGEFDDISSLNVSFGSGATTMMVGLVESSGRPGDQETILVDVTSGEILAEEKTWGELATPGGFLGHEFESSGTSQSQTLFHYSTSGEQQEIAPDISSVSIDPSGSMLWMVEQREQGERALLMASIDGTGVGPVVEIEEYDTFFSSTWIAERLLLIVDQEGVVGVSDGRDLLELGELRTEVDDWIPQIQTSGEDVWSVVAGGAVGVVVGGSNPNYIEIDDLENINGQGVVSSDGRWLVLSGQEDLNRSDVSLVVVDLQSGESEVVDDFAGLALFPQIFDGDIYVTTRDDDDIEVRRVPLGLNERAEEIAEDVRLFVPQEPRRARQSWDASFVDLQQ